MPLYAVRTALGLFVLSLAILAEGKIPRKVQATQSATPTRYRLRFVVREVRNGRTLQSHEYDTYLIADRVASDLVTSIRTGTRAPLTGGPAGPPPGVPLQYSHTDVMIDLHDSRVESHHLFSNVRAEVTNVDVGAAAANGLSQPLIRQNTWNAAISVVVGTPTIIFSSDDGSYGRTTQLELTATEAN